MASCTSSPEITQLQLILRWVTKDPILWLACKKTNKTKTNKQTKQKTVKEKRKKKKKEKKAIPLKTSGS